MIRFLLRLGYCAVVAAIAYYVLGKLSQEIAFLRIPLTIVFTAPLWAQQFTGYLIELIPAIHRSAHRSVHEPWQGRYYAYEGNQIRFYITEENIWVAEADIRRIMRPHPDARELRLLRDDYAQIPDEKIKGFTEKGLLKLLAARTNNRRAHYDMIRFKRWLEQEALPNVKRLPVSSA